MSAVREYVCSMKEYVCSMKEYVCSLSAKVCLQYKVKDLLGNIPNW